MTLVSSKNQVKLINSFIDEMPSSYTLKQMMRKVTTVFL